MTGGALIGLDPRRVAEVRGTEDTSMTGGGLIGLEVSETRA
jgi:hypothetical protein